MTSSSIIWVCLSLFSNYCITSCLKWVWYICVDSFLLYDSINWMIQTRTNVACQLLQMCEGVVSELCGLDRPSSIFVRTIGRVVGALRSPHGGVGGAWVVLVQLVSSLVLLADLSQVVHAQAAQLFSDGALALHDNNNYYSSPTNKKINRKRFTAALRVK